MKSITTFLLLSCLSISHGWQCKQGPQHSGAAQIDAGHGEVVMRDGNLNAYVLKGSTWTPLGSVSLQHVSVGPAGTWGVDSSHNVYKYVGGNFIQSTGHKLSQVDAGGDGEVVGVTSSSSIHCLRSGSASAFQQMGSLSWNLLPGQLVYFSCSSRGCWGVNSADNIYYTGISPITCEIGRWIQVDGAARMVEVGADGTVFVVNAAGQLYQRTGISLAEPQGTGWNLITMPGTIKHVTYDLSTMWVITSAGVIMQCSDSGWHCQPGPSHLRAARIDAGQGLVVMTDANSLAFLLSGSTWNRLGTRFISHVSVGPAGIWGVDSSHQIFKYVANDFVQSHGQHLQQVDAGGDGQVVGVTSASHIYCLKNGLASSFYQTSSLDWNLLPGELVHFSCSPRGCWGVNSVDHIYFTKVSPDSCQISGWTRVDGAAKMVEVGIDGTIFVVNAAGQLYQRNGISTSVPQGTGWLQIPMTETLKHATFDLGNLWLITNSGVILQCTR